MGILKRLFNKQPTVERVNVKDIATEAVNSASKCYGIAAAMLERAYQIDHKGYSEYSDEQYHDDELLYAARCYLEVALGLEEGLNPSRMLSIWPWDDELFKPSLNEIDNLMKASALICADLNVRIKRILDSKSGGLGDTRIHKVSVGEK